MTNNRPFFRKVWSVLLYTLLVIFSVILLFIIFIYTPPGKKVVRNRVQNYLQQKLQTKVTIGAVDYSLPQWLEIKRIYIEDQSKDTLLYGEELSADLNMLKLLRGNTDIQKLFFKNILINVHRAKTDSNFNYQFVVDAFTGNKSTTSIPDTAALKMSLDRLIFDNVAFRSKDEFGGQDFVARIKHLDTRLNKFQPDRINFGINSFVASGIDFFMSSYEQSVRDSLILAAPDTVKPATTYGLYVTAGNFNVRDVNVTIEDKVTGMYYANKVTKMDLTNALLNIKQSLIVADSFRLDSSFVKFIQPVEKTVKIVDTTLVPWLIQAKQLNIANSQFQYDDVNIPKAGGFDMAHMDASGIRADINSFIFSEDSTSAFVRQLAFADAGGFRIDSTHTNFRFTNHTLSASELYVRTPKSIITENFEIRYDSIAAMKLYPQNSLINAKLTNSIISFDDLYMLFPFLKSSFPPASFANNSVRVNTELRGNLQRLYLPYFELAGLSGSRLSGSGTLFNLTDPLRFSYDIRINSGFLQKRDILKFIPAGDAAAMARLPSAFSFSGHLVGDRNNVTADISTRSPGLSFAGRVTLNNISSPAGPGFDLAVSNAAFDRNFILGFFPKGSIPSNISLPQRIEASGKFKGSANDFVADLKLGGSYGRATLKGYMRNMKNPEIAEYDLDITANNFQLGKLIKQDTIIGNITGAIKAKGRGFNYQTMVSSIQANLQQLQYNDYNYQNLLVDADFNRGAIRASGTVNDPNLVMSFNGRSNMSSQYPSFIGTVKVDTARLFALNLTTDTMDFSGFADINAPSTTPRNLDVNAVLRDVRLVMGTQRVALDTVSLIGTSSNGIDDIKLNTNFARVHAYGAFDYDKVGPSIMQYVNHYYALTPRKPDAVIAYQQMQFEGDIQYSPVLTGLVPGLNDYRDLRFSGSYASANTDSALNFTASVPYLAYTSYKITNGKIDIASRNERLNYNVSFDTLNYLANNFFGTRINGAASNDSLSINAITQDDQKRDWFGANATLTVAEDAFSFRLSDRLLLNYENWNVAPDNLINVSSRGLYINNFSISSDTARIYLNSRQPVPNSPIDVTVDNFNLKSISSFFSTDTLLTSGVLDAKFVVSELDKEIPAFTGNASVENFEFKQIRIGNLTAFAERQAGDIITGRVNLQGNNNDITVSGNYFMNNTEQQFIAEMDIKQLNFATVQALSLGTLTNASGNLHGRINLRGKFASPQWNGNLVFDTTRFTLAQFGTPYKINNQRINFDYPAIEFREFLVRDSLDNLMRINGDITANDLYKYNLNLRVNATDFIIMNAPKAIGNELYGFASVDADLNIRGNSERPDVQGNVFVNDKSNVTIVLPETSYNSDGSKTIVRFIDRDTFAINSPLPEFEPEEKSQINFASFINYNLNIEINKNSTLTIIVDPATGDELTVQGDAQLNAGVDPGGNIILAGNYELDKGTYTLNYQFIQRKFNLVKGSTMSFAGTPMSARINITAEYIANTSAKDLLNNEVADVSSSLSNSFNQKIPFKVMLYLTGVLSQPDINFDILLPENNQLVNSDLSTTIENKLVQLRGDVAALNKQVFALLLLNRFVGEQSSDFFKGNGSDFSDLARQSVSQFLSAALNEIASDLFKGIDVDLNLNTYRDYSDAGSASRTDLTVALSKSFLDDRLTVTVGKNFGIEGDDPAAKVQSQQTGFMPDVNIAYKLTKDGKYLIRAYRRNQFEVLLDGFVIETGLGFVVTMDFDKFNELFRRKK